MDSLFGWMANAAIDSSGGGDKVFGRKPKVAGYTETDLTTEAGKAARGNLANMPDIMALLEKILPGYGEMLKQGGTNTLSLLRGELPKDVQSAVKRNAAFKSLMGGFSGSGMSKALEARDFGRTSLDLMQMGENSAQKWAGLSQGGVKPFMVTAPDQADATFKNNLYNQITQQHQYNVDAAPDPSAAGLFNLRTALGMSAMSFGMGSIAGMGGGAAGAAQQPAAAPASGGTSGYTNGPQYANSSSLGNWWGTYG